MSGKTVTFACGEENQGLEGGRLDGGGSMREMELGKWLVGMLLVGLDFVWRWVGARDGLQEERETGQGWEGWVWRSSVVSWA